MKKFKIIMYASFLIGCVSCQKPKDWVCTCDVKPIGGSSKTVTTTITNKTQSDANTSCTNYGQAAVNGNGTWKCTIK